MTKEEAIKALKWFKAYNEEDFCGGDRIQDEYGDWYYRITEQDFEAFEMAIKALEQEPTTKNNLEVDWESYKDVGGNSLDDLILEVLQNNFDCGNTYGYKVADEIIGLLPSVTPQEPRKGHWIRVSKDKLRCSECDVIHFIAQYPQGKIDWCPNCGADMREVEEV